MSALNTMSTLLISLVVFLHIQTGYAANITTTQGLKVVNGNERVLVQPWGQNAIRVRSSVYSDPTGHELGSILDPPDGINHTIGTATATTITYNDTALVKNGILTVNITNSRLSFWRTQGSNDATLLLQEFWPTHGYQARARSYTTAGATSQGSARFAFTLDQDEQVFGFGQHQHGVLNNKGETYDFRNFESEITVPSFISSKSYGLLWNVPALGGVSINKREIIWTAESARVIDYMVIAAAPCDFAAIMDSHTAATGRPAVMPEVARGFIQSKNRYASQAEVMSIADGFAQRGTNVSMIVIDAHHWIYFGDWSFNRSAFPNPGQMASYVRNKTQAELMVSVWPLVQSQCAHWLNMTMLGLLAGASEGPGWVDYQSNLEAMQEIDPTNPDTRAYVFQKLKDNYAAYGIRNFWLDSNEGAELGDGFLFKDANTMPLEAVPYARPNLFFSAGSATEVNPLYGYYEQKMIEDGTRSIGTEAYSISLTRNFWLGSQRFRSTPWNGDVDSSWEAFPLQITAGLNTQLSGITYWNTDVGGYYSGTSYYGNISNPIYQELAVRWYQYGAFSPIFRAHGTRTCAPSAITEFGSCPNEFWTYGNEIGPILQQYITLRYSLGPYISAIMDAASRRGTPLQRPLFFDFASSDLVTIQQAESLKLQFMFGPSLLVAPVTTYGARSWKVYLPATGTNMSEWRSWWTDEFVRGGQWLNVSAPLNQVPLFYRGAKEDILSGNIA